MRFGTYRDRNQAGEVLASWLSHYKHRPELLVLGLPRGGVPVAFQVARELQAPLDVFLVRKLGVPFHQELAMGAIASGGIRVLNESVLRNLNISAEAIEEAAARESRELERREKAYRGNRPPLEVARHTVILVDDGLATGSTMRAAIAALRRRQPAHLVVAVPVASPDTIQAFESEVDEIVCPLQPPDFQAVGQFYENFSQTTDGEVSALLEAATVHAHQQP